MSTTGTIMSLYSDREQQNAILPRTKTKAITDDNNKGLDAILSDLQIELDSKATEAFVANKIAEAKLDGEGSAIDLSGYATKDDLTGYAKTTDLTKYVKTTDTIQVSKGGTGLTSVTANNFLVGNGTGALKSITPATALSTLGVKATAAELSSLEGSVGSIQDQLNNLASDNVKMVQLSATGDLTDSNSVTISNAAEYDLFLVYLRINNNSDSYTQVVLPKILIGATSSEVFKWHVSDTANAKVFKAYFSGTNLILTSTAYTGSGVKGQAPIVYGIKITTIDLPVADDVAGTEVAGITVNTSNYSTNVTDAWKGSSQTQIWSGVPSNNNYSYFSRIELVTPSTVPAHTKLVLQVELNQSSYPGRCMGVLTTSKLSSTSVQNSGLSGASSTLSNSAIATCAAARKSDLTTAYTSGTLSSGKTVYFVFNTSTIKPNTTYYIYLLPNKSSSNWFSSKRSLISAALY